MPGAVRAGFALTLGLSLLVQACTTSTVTGVDVGSVVVEPGSATLMAGEEVVFTAQVRDAEGTVIPDPQVTWSSASPGVVSIGPDGGARALEPGSATITASFQGATGQAEVTVSPGPRIVVSRDSVTLYADVLASAPDPTVLQVSNGGVGALEGLSASVEYESGSGWLSPGLNATTAPALLTLVAATDQLAEGSYRATVSLSAPGTVNSPVEIPVRLSLSRGMPILALDESVLELAVPPGSSASGSISIPLRNRGGGSLGAVGATVAFAPGAPSGWLSAGLAEDEGGASLLEVRLEPQALGQGRYDAEIRLTADNAVNSPLPLPVSLNVTPDARPWGGFTLQPTGGSTRVGEENGTDQVSVVLDQPPTSDVVLRVSTSDPGEAVASPETLIFAPDGWDTPQLITVTGVDDAVQDGDTPSTLTVSVDDARSDDAFDPFPDQTAEITTVDDDTPPTASITGPAARSFVQGQSIRFTGEAQDREDGALGGSSLVWTSDRQSPARLGTGTTVTRSDLAVGTHTIRLTATDSDGYTDTDQITLTVAPPPQDPPSAGFTVSCSGVECSFTDTSSDPDGSVVGWSWSFGDGGSSNQQNPTHTYVGDGSYTVRLTVTDDDGATDAVTRNVTISGRPSADFTASCSGLECSFSDASFDADGSVEAWLWDFGDGNGSTSRNPSHQYTTGGSYTVTLVVTDDEGRESPPATRNVSVNALPVARFTASCSRLECSFDESSSDPDGSVVAWSWDFGDGSGSEARQPSHTYSAGGSYTVRLTVTDDDGATNSTTRTVNASAPPEAAFSVDCDGLTCRFTDDSRDPGGSIVSRSWDFGDGSSGGGASETHTYASGGDYTVRLTVTDDDGATDSATRTVSVNEPPVADFGIDCDDPTCAFRDRSEDPDGSVVSWSWDFGGDGSSTQENPSHTFSQGGEYAVTLTVTDDDGATASRTRTLSVDAPPLPSFTYDCSALTCEFRDTSTDPGGFVNLRIWWLGDGAIRFGRSITYTYRRAGTYGVTLTVVDNDGETARVERSVTVPPRPPS